MSDSPSLDLKDNCAVDPDLYHLNKTNSTLYYTSDLSTTTPPVAGLLDLKHSSGLVFVENKSKFKKLTCDTLKKIQMPTFITTTAEDQHPKAVRGSLQEQGISICIRLPWDAAHTFLKYLRRL